MNQFWKKVTKTYKTIYKWFLFLISIAFIVYIFPREGKFPYEYQKGKPWLHESLTAPYNVPIRKSEETLKAERDSIHKMFRPYFSRQEDVASRQLEAFEEGFDSKWKSFVRRDSLLSGWGQSLLADSLKQLFYDYGNKTLSFIYERGVLTQKDLVGKPDDEEFYVVVMNDQVAQEYIIDELFDMERSSTYIEKELVQFEEKFEKQFDSLRFFYDEFNLSDYIRPNLSYDAKTTRKVKDEQLENVALSEGMIKAGEKIITQGEVVNERKFRALESYRQEYEANLTGSSRIYFIIGGQALLVIVSMLILYLFMFSFRKDILENSLKTMFILLMVNLFVLAGRLGIMYQDILNLYLVPFVLLPVIIRTFFDTRTALFIHIITIVLIGFMAPNSYEFVFMQFIAGNIALFTLANIERRSQLFVTAGLVFLSYVTVYTGIGIVQHGELSEINYELYAWFAGNGLLLLSTYPLIYIFEKTFGFLSDVTLMELSDTNHPLLRELSEKAPGTFQHSLQVASLAQEALYKIGGKPQLARTGALYHDIGKTINPLFFIENQVSGHNPHDNIEFDESANIIIGHVKKGVEIAKKHGLPEQIIDFIRTHHGTTKVQYFYRSYINKFPDRDVDVGKFTYPGPIPFSRETAVVMMADSVEAASRSLKTYTEDTINNLVENIIDSQVKANQFVNADVTYKDISTVKELFKIKLRNIHHARIEYPDEKKKG